MILGLLPLFTKYLNRYLLFIAISILAFFIYEKAHETQLINIGIYFWSLALWSAALLLISFFLTFFFFKLLRWVYYRNINKTLKIFCILIMQGLVIILVLFDVFVMAPLTFFAPGWFTSLVFYVLLGFNTVFFISILLCILYLLILLNLIIERLLYFLLDQKVFTNRKIAIPIGLFLISASSFLAKPITDVVKELLDIFKG